MDVILLTVSIVSESPGVEVLYDVGFPWPVMAVGLAILLAIGAGIIFLMIAAVKFLMRIKNGKIKDKDA